MVIKTTAGKYRGYVGVTPDVPVFTRWALTPVEREKILNGADIVLTVFTNGEPVPGFILKVCNSDEFQDLWGV